MCLMGVFSLTCTPKTVPFTFFFPFITYHDFLDSITVHKEMRSLSYGILRECREFEQQLLSWQFSSLRRREGRKLTAIEHLLLVPLLDVCDYDCYALCLVLLSDVFLKSKQPNERIICFIFTWKKQGLGRQKHIVNKWQNQDLNQCVRISKALYYL